MAKAHLAWTSFEDAIYDALKQAITSGFLPFDPHNARVKRNACYPSADGKRLIKIETAIEVYREGASAPFLISLWECKQKETRKVEIGVVRELRSKIEEIGIARCSGAIVTSIGFQRGAIELAESLGLSLFLLESEYRFIPITKYAQNAEPESRRAIFVEYALDGEGTIHSNVLFDDLIRLHLRRTCGLQA